MESQVKDFPTISKLVTRNKTELGHVSFKKHTLNKRNTKTKSFPNLLVTFVGTYLIYL